MTRTEIINHLILKHQYKSYLEIGVQTSTTNFDKIKCAKKVGVDPSPRFFSQIKPGISFFKIPSDEFFVQNRDTFDICFVDGLHEADQVFADIINCLKILNEGGIIVCHDMSPRTENAQKVPRIQAEWNGDCWKAFVKLRKYRSDLEMFVIDTDQGCGVIRKGIQETLKITGELEWPMLVENRKEWLNLISPKEFLSEQ